MSLHPLIQLSNDPAVRQAAGFREAATGLTGEELAVLYQRELENAPRRQEAGKKYFVAPNSKLASERRRGRDDEHLAIALVGQCRASGEGIALPEDAGAVEFLHPLVPLKSAAEDKQKGEADPNRGVGRIDVLGAGPDDRMVVAKLKFVASDATRGRTGDTPLRALLEGLAESAIASANREALQGEVAGVSGRQLADAPPLLLIVGSPRYWELCRRREAQKGAAWIKELERLAREIGEAIGVGVHYLTIQLQGDPGWSYDRGAPALDAPPRFGPAWEPGAGRVRPKARPRPKALSEEARVVEADFSRPVRTYALTETYSPGDRISHGTLGDGVVQGPAGPGKIEVLFGDKKTLLVHGREPAGDGPAPGAPGGRLA